MDPSTGKTSNVRALVKLYEQKTEEAKQPGTGKMPNGRGAEYPTEMGVEQRPVGEVPKETLTANVTIGLESSATERTAELGSAVLEPPKGGNLAKMRERGLLETMQLPERPGVAEVPKEGKVKELTNRELQLQQELKTLESQPDAMGRVQEIRAEIGAIRAEMRREEFVSVHQQLDTEKSSLQKVDQETKTLAKEAKDLKAKFEEQKGEKEAVGEVLQDIQRVRARVDELKLEKAILEKRIADLSQKADALKDTSLQAPTTTKEQAHFATLQAQSSSRRSEVGGDAASLIDILKNIDPDTQKLRLEGGKFEVVGRERGVSFREGTSAPSQAAVGKMLSVVEQELKKDPPLTAEKKEELRTILDFLQTSSWGQGALKHNAALRRQHAELAHSPALFEGSPETSRTKAAAHQVQLAHSIGGKLTVVNGKIVAVPRKGVGQPGRSQSAQRAINQVFKEILASKFETKAEAREIASYLKHDEWAQSALQFHGLEGEAERIIDQSESFVQGEEFRLTGGDKEATNLLSDLEGLLNKTPPDYDNIRLKYGELLMNEKAMAYTRGGNAEIQAQMNHVERRLADLEEKIPGSLRKEDTMHFVLDGTKSKERAAFLHQYRWRMSTKEMTASMKLELAKTNSPLTWNTAYTFCKSWCDDPKAHQNNKDDMKEMLGFLRSINSTDGRWKALADDLQARVDAHVETTPYEPSMTSSMRETFEKHAHNGDMLDTRDTILASVADPGAREVAGRAFRGQMAEAQLNILRGLDNREFQKSAWDKTPDKAPRVTECAVFTTNLTNEVSSLILACNDESERIEMASFFMEQAVRCLDEGDFNTAAAINASLNSGAILRIIKDGAFGPDALEHQTILETRVSPSAIRQINKQYDDFRREHPNTACIPYIGNALTDLTFGNDGNQNNPINAVQVFEKVTTSLFSTFEPAGSLAPTPPEGVLPRFLEGMRAAQADDTGMYKKSLEIKPRQRAATT